MAGTGVHVDHQALEAQAQRLASNHSDLTGVLGSIRSQIQELTSSGFVTDSASGSFADAAERWNTAATTCIAELTTMGEYLNRTSAAFADTDQGMTIRG